MQVPTIIPKSSARVAKPAKSTSACSVMASRQSLRVFAAMVDLAASGKQAAACSLQCAQHLRSPPQERLAAWLEAAAV